LALWHPFATAIFLGFYFGRYLSNFATIEWRQHIKIWAVLVGATLTAVILLSLSPRTHQQLNALGFLASYRTNEVNVLASIVAWALAQLTVLSTPINRIGKLTASIVFALLGVSFLTLHLPLLLLWIFAALFKLVCMRNWGLLVPLFVALILPYGGGLGGPMYGLFAIILSVFVTCLDWTAAEDALGFISGRSAFAFVIVLALMIVTLRSGSRVPLISSLAKPLFVERERTYQLEQTLSWLASSEYCSYNIEFTRQGGDPVDDVENAITRQNRPPTTISDVGLFWDSVLRCKATVSTTSDKVVTITFGEDELAQSKNIFELPGTNAGPIKAWIRHQ
jgi:hypothetical protein